MDIPSLVYAINQVIHNFGAATVVATPIFALWASRYTYNISRTLAWIMLVGWGVQAASGTSFSMISLYYHGAFPDIQGVALVALLIKISCVIIGFLLTLFYIWKVKKGLEQHYHKIWWGQNILSITALTAAAFLRWFS